MVASASVAARRSVRDVDRFECGTSALPSGVSGRETDGVSGRKLAAAGGVGARETGGGVLKRGGVGGESSSSSSSSSRSCRKNFPFLLLYPFRQAARSCPSASSDCQNYFLVK
jgi:hypothetical protein